MDIVRSCEYALQLERESRDYFTENAARLGHPATAAVYRGLAEEADKHIKFLKGILKAVKNGTLATLPRVAADVQGELGARSLAQVMDEDIARQLQPDVAILRLGLILHADIAAFYQDSAQRLVGTEQKAFERLAEWSEILRGIIQSLYDPIFALYLA